MESIGSGFGFVFHIFFINPDDEHYPDLARQHVFNLCITSAIGFTILFGILMAIFRGKPIIPPTYSASFLNNEPLLVSLKSLIVDKNFLLIAQTIGFVYACLCTFSQELAFVTFPYGFNSFDNAIIGVGFVVLGTLGAAGSSIFISKTKKYKTMLVIVCFGTLLSVAIFMGTLVLQNKIVTLVCASLIGMFSMSILAVSLDFASETTFPVPGNNSTGILMTYSQVICTGLILLSSFIVTTEDTGLSGDPKEKAESLGICLSFIICLSISAICSIFVKELLKKTKYDRRRSSLIDLPPDEEEPQETSNYSKKIQF